MTLQDGGSGIAATTADGAAASASGDASKVALAGQVWHRMFDFLIQTRPQREAVLARLGLTPNESRALYSLDAGRGRTMGELARDWECDASTATWCVNRLERLGLAERRSHPTDRRVRLVVLTPVGAARRRELVQGMYSLPPELLQLTTDQLRSLRDLLEQLPGERAGG